MSFDNHIKWSTSYEEAKVYKSKVEQLYKKGLELVTDSTLYGYKVDINNPKEIIAVLYLLAEDYNRYHEKF